MENEIIAKEKGFIYKGNYYDNGDLTISNSYFLIDTETEKEYSLYACSYKDIPVSGTYKLEQRYEIRKGFNTLETFKTEDEAKDFIKIATQNIK